MIPKATLVGGSVATGRVSPGRRVKGDDPDSMFSMLVGGHGANGPTP